jgi:ribonuclease Z
VTEVHPGRTITKIYVCQDRFRPQKARTDESFSGILLQEPSFHVGAALLDHRVPCLGFSLVENFYVNIIKEGLRELGIPVGPWINRFKKALYEKRELESDFIVSWEERRTRIREERYTLGDLATKIARISPGQKIVYITDIIGSPENYEKVAQLAQKADHLFIEAAFMDSEKKRASEKYHLTAKEAGELAKKAGVKQFTLFHFSPRYNHRAEDVKREALKAFR